MSVGSSQLAVGSWQLAVRSWAVAEIELITKIDGKCESAELMTTK
jgi:hypothetical protein